MKNLYAYLLFVLTLSTYSQTIIRASVKDAITKEPIISASVGLKNSAIGTITNEEGAFQLTVPTASHVIISCLGYKTRAIPVADFKVENITFFLNQSEELLEEVVVTKTPLYQLLGELVTTSKARFNKPILLHTYYREFARSNGKPSKFADGLLDYHLSGGTKRTQSKVIVQQNRSVALVSEDDEDAVGSLLNVQKAMFNSYDFAFITKCLLEDKRYEDYDLELKSKKDKDGNVLCVMIFNPKSEIEKSLYKGSVTFDPRNKLIYDLEVFSAPSHQKYAKEHNFLLLKFCIQDSRFKAVYKLAGDNYVLSYNNQFLNLKAWNRKNLEVIESRSDLIVTDFEKDTEDYSHKELFKKKHLYQKPSQYTDKFWQKNNAIVLTQEEEKIIKDLEISTVARTN